MKTRNAVINLKILLFNILSVVLLFNLNAQSIATSRNSSYFTYIYKISNAHARKIHLRGVDFQNESFFTILVDSFPTNHAYRKSLPIGHYLLVKAVENNLNVEMKSINDIAIQVLNNSVDLCIKVYKTDGSLIKEAKLYLNHKRIHFDNKTNTYRLKNTNKDGILEVSFAGQSAFFQIEKDKNNSRIKKGLIKVLYKSPVKYVYRPANFIVNIPIDLFKTLGRHYGYGSIYKICRPFKDIGTSIGQGMPQGFIKSLFYLFDHSYSPWFNGVLYYSQPKYKPGDTVRFEAFVFDKNNRPVTDSLWIDVFNNTYKKIGYCKPLRPGIFNFEFKITPSLGLKLDKSYSISLKNPVNLTVASGSFKYEDYELRSTDFAIRSDRKTYRPHQPVTLYCKATDENELIVPDARVKLAILSSNVSKYKKDLDFVPDTLWKHEQDLDPTGETKIILPDSIFPEVDMDIKVDAKFRTSSNEWQDKKVTFKRMFDYKELTFKIKSDSVYIDYIEKGISKPRKAELSIDDMDTTIQLPWKEKLNPLNNVYYVCAEGICDFFEVRNEQPSVSCIANRTKDSVLVSLGNPRNLPLVYFVYKKNRCIYRGTEKKLQFACKNTTRANYFVSLHYLWAGEINSNEYKIGYADKELLVKPIEPPVIYPGQNVKISVAVTDKKGKPVPNASLLAYSHTKKFGKFTPSTMPYLGKKHLERNGYNTFEGDELNLNQKTFLNWNKWNPIMGLDSIELFRFLYPEKGVYQTSFPTKDEVTQVAPYLVKNGKLVPINILYLDGAPVYFNLVNAERPYSFKISPGLHKLIFRTTKEEIVMDSLFLRKGHKTIVSIDVDSAKKKLASTPKKSYYDLLEISTINQYLFKVSPNIPQNAYLSQGDYYTFLKPLNYSNLNYIVGPFQNSPIKFNIGGDTYYNFMPEPNSKYQFYKHHYSTEATASVALKRAKTSAKTPSRNFTELAYTSKNVQENWQKTINYFQTNTSFYKNPFQTQAGNGVLRIEYIANQKEAIKNVILLSLTDSITARVYNGNEQMFHNLAPGFYKLVLLFQDNYFFINDSVRIKPNGTNFLRMKNCTLSPPDIRMEAVNAIISKRLHNLNEKIVDAKIDQARIAATFKFRPESTTRPAMGNADQICGVVSDQMTNEPLPGVSVYIQNTSLGTVTDMAGRFCITAPVGSILVFAYVGYIIAEVTVPTGRVINIELSPDLKSLDEVVVVGYGTPKSALTGSVTSEYLQGRVSGVDLSSNIMIRGMSSIDGKTPMYIIDGVPVTSDVLNLNSDEIEKLEMLKGEVASAIYGSKGANGVVLVTTKKGSKNKALQNSSTENPPQENSLRNNFSDLAFWKPALITDKNGIASFEVKFPDDITAWNTFYFAYGAKSTGQSNSQIKSFKPLVGTLALPRFLVKGDVTDVIGKAVNYTSDTVTISTSFEVTGKPTKQTEHKLITSALDTLRVTATSNDTLSITYKLVKNDGYTDGEKRDMPIFPVGTKEVVGKFWTLEKDTSFSIELDKTYGEATLVADAHPLSVALDELAHIRNYSYLCNEQAASKLKALLAEKRIMALLGKEFSYDRDIKKLIDKLEGSRNEDGLWGWWPNTPYTTWISQHVIEALVDAQTSGYTVKWDFKKLFTTLVYEFDRASSWDKIRILKVLRKLDSENNYFDYAKKINLSQLSFNERLEYIEMMQLIGQRPVIDTLMKWKKETYLSNWYWGTEQMSLFDDAIASTLAVYRIFKKSGIYPEMLPKMRDYLLERRGTMHWRNTYESMNILEAILPDLLVNKSLPENPSIKVEGALVIDTSGFPVKRTFIPNNKILVGKTGDYPVYLTVWQNRWDPNPIPVDKDFVVKTYFENKDSVLNAGEAVTLVAEVKVKKSSDYVMIEVPIPAGCSYEDKARGGWPENHREFFKEKVVIFSSYLGEGTYKFPIRLMPRYNGIYTINPAKAELMYFPVMFGRNKIKTVEVR